VTDWIRRDFDDIGVTQSPPGRHLGALQERYVGKVLLCLDVSGSMSYLEAGKTRLAHAVDGARQFIADAIAAHYRVGLVLWHHHVAATVPLSRDSAPVLAALRKAHSSGGNDLTHTLQLGIQTLGHLTGDRVMAIFGDGDIGPPAPSIELARQASALGIRIIVRGLGEHAAAALGQIATEDGAAMVATVARGVDIAAGISSMTSSLTGLARRAAKP
jgi:Mg-chelatase subunit ChlD